jgi:hypothetical protein
MCRKNSNLGEYRCFEYAERLHGSRSYAIRLFGALEIFRREGEPRGEFAHISISSRFSFEGKKTSGRHSVSESVYWYSRRAARRHDERISWF